MKHFKQEVAYLSIDRSINQSFLNLLKLGFEQSKNDLKPVNQSQILYSWMKHHL